MNRPPDRPAPARRLLPRLLRWAFPLLALGLVLTYAAGRRPSPPSPFSETRFLMGTVVTVTLWGLEGEQARRASEGAFAALEAVDREMARIPGTPLWDLNRAGGGTLSPPLAEVVGASLAWAHRTGGVFDPTVAPLLDLWGLGDGADVPRPPPDAEELGHALGRVGWGRLVWDPEGRRLDLAGTELDLGGIAKGYAVDRAVAALRSRGARHFIVNAGGDLFVAGAKGPTPWRVGIQHPRDPAGFLRVVSPTEGALVTSGDYERAYSWDGERVHHVLDPRTGRPARGCQAVTVWAPRALTADALATAVFVLGPEEGLALLESEPGAEGLVVDAQGAVRETSGFRRVAPEAAPR